MKKIIVTQNQLNLLESYLKKKQKLNEDFDVDGVKIPKKVLSRIVEETYKTTKEMLGKKNLKESFEAIKNTLISEGYTKKAMNELDFESLYNKIQEREMDESLIGMSGNDRTYGNNKPVKQFFSKLGSMFGNPIDVLTKSIETKVDAGELSRQEGDRVFAILKPDVDKKKIKKDDIESAVQFAIDTYIKTLNEGKNKLKEKNQKNVK